MRLFFNTVFILFLHRSAFGDIPKNEYRRPQFDRNDGLNDVEQEQNGIYFYNRKFFMDRN